MLDTRPSLHPVFPDLLYHGAQANLVRRTKKQKDKAKRVADEDSHSDVGSGSDDLLAEISD